MTTNKRCTDCKHTKGIGYDFWCGEGHTEYEVFGAETNCPYYEYHDWSKGTPSKTEKRFVAIGVEWTDGFIQDHISDRDLFNIGAVCNLLNDLSEENEQLKKELFEARKDYILETYADNPIRRDERLKALEKELQEMIEITPMSWQKCAFQVYKYQRLYCQLKQKWCNSKDCKEQMI